MRKYLLSAFLVLSFPQIAVAESNLVANQSHQQLSIINDWLAYQEFESTLQQTNEASQKKFETPTIDDLDERYEQMKIEGQKQNKILANMLNQLQPQTQELTEIQKLWLALLQNEIKAVDEGQNTDDSEIDTKLEKIDVLNSTLEAKVFHLIQQHNPPEDVNDWIAYKQLKIDMEKKRAALEQSLNSLFKQASDKDKLKLQQDFIQKITQTQLNMLHGFKTNSSELKDIIAMQIQATESAKKMNLTAVSTSSLNADEMNEVGEISDQIEKLEHRFEAKIAEYVRSLI